MSRREAIRMVRIIARACPWLTRRDLKDLRFDLMLLTLCLCALVVPSLALAQEKPLCLELAVWHPHDMRLEWAMSDGGANENGGCAVPRSGINMLRFTVDFKRAVMIHKGEERPFDIGEAVDVRRMLHNLVSQYAGASTAWWFAPPPQAESPKSKVQSPKSETEE
jgi:hypothetical protein